MPRKNIKIVHKNLPLDTSCNAYLQSPFHQGSCIDAQYVIAAEKQGKLWDMNEILFEKKPQTEDEILKLVENKGFNLEKLQEDANSLETMNQIKDEIDFAYKHGINGTPSTMINNEVYVGVKPYKEFKEWIEKNGAEKK